MIYGSGRIYLSGKGRANRSQTATMFAKCLPSNEKYAF